MNNKKIEDYLAIPFALAILPTLVAFSNEMQFFKLSADVLILAIAIIVVLLKAKAI